MTARLPYGAWPSPLAASDVVAGVVGFAELSLHGSSLCWLESRPAEQGRTTLMTHDLGEGVSRELTPAPWNVRSRVHEYGGGAYCVAAECAYFIDAEQQNLHEVSPAGIRQITNSDAGERFADFQLDAAGQRLISIVERHGNGEPANFLGAVDLASGAVNVLHDRHDFYSAPRLNPAGTRLAFLAWDHPNMPWDGCLLMTGTLSSAGVDNLTHVAGGAEESVAQPGWLDDERLTFVSDLGGYYNLYRLDDTGVHCLHLDAADYAQPAWVFAQHDYAAIDATHLAAVRQTPTGPELMIINGDTGMASPLTDEGDPWRAFDSLAASDGALFFIASFTDRLPSIERFEIASRSTSTIAAAGGPALPAGLIAHAQSLSYPTRDGSSAHAYFYPPTSIDCAGPDSEAPPLLVKSHGGPTAATDSALNMRTQYYTSRGWAVLDVNYRGSSGFGRAYRTALNGRWGLRDVEDCEDGVRHLIAQGRVDPARVAIRGGSAGGYTTLAALTSTTTFRCGASHYGIGDLQALARDTHKFESHYLHTLLSSEEDLMTRSPIHNLDGLSCPVIFFQGGEDKVVPPNQAEAMVEALERKGLPVAYLLFPGEGHGFRQADNMVRALSCEFAFFSIIFGIEVPEQFPDFDIRGLPQADAS